ncbi:hypothetical protein [Kitasatospora sp. GP82]|uniref:hypothetical protein n=1 Tax=Kitasatospora sp. GP82 TaxID=3035089 RepID=UPI0024751AFE|nr:hypothetical protein [Kitasatospora sp. GP82]
MKYENRPGDDEGRLTTEDLARSRTTDDEELGASAQKDTESRDDRPVFPGEATDTGLSREDEEAPVTDEAEAQAGPATEEPAETRDRATGEGHPRSEEQPLFSSEDEHEVRDRWQEIQNDFVDDPRQAVQAADALVADLMQRLAGSFAEHKERLEQQWNRGDEVQTEDLRLALQQYRSFFNRLLSS